MILITFVIGYGLQAFVNEKRTVKREFCVPSIGYVIEADFKNWAKIFGVTQLIPFVSLCPCSFFHDSEVLLGEKLHGIYQQCTLLHDLAPDSVFVFPEAKTTFEEKRIQSTDNRKNEMCCLDTFSDFCTNC